MAAQMKVGMSTACFFGREYNEYALRQMAKLGVRYAEVFFSGQAEFAPQYMDEFKRIADGEGMRVAAVHALPTQFEPQLFSRHERQFAEALSVYDRVLAAARELGAENYVFHGPVYLKVARKLEIDFNYVGERLDELCERARAAGVALCWETVHWCWYQRPGFAKELLAHTKSDNLFFTLDMKQAAQSGYDAAEYMDDMGARLRHIHVCDFVRDKEKGVTPCLPFTGEADWQGVRQKLYDMNYNSYLMLEVYAQNYGSYAELGRTLGEVGAFFTRPLPEAPCVAPQPAPLRG